MPAIEPSASSVVQATAAIRRVIAARVRDPHDREDLIQTTLVKVAAAQGRLGDATLEGYAIVTARNVVIGHYRTETTRKRHVHRLVEYTSFAGPEELTLRREETDALATALTRLHPADRRLLLAHEVDGTSTAELAHEHDSTPGGVAVRLARARARLRLEFLLVFRNLDQLPTEQCRPVLVALSAGDRRRQATLHAGEHLLQCDTCASLSQPLIERKRSIAGFLPLAGLRPLSGGLRRILRSGKGQAAVGVTVAAGVITVAVLAQPTPTARVPIHTTNVVAPRPRPPIPPARPHSPLMSGVLPLLPIPAGGLARFDGRAVTAQKLLVLSVPANEGAWLGTDPTNRVWVEFIGPGESPFHIVPGQHLTFAGALKKNAAAYSESIGLEDGPDANYLDLMDLHIEVAYPAVHIG